MPIQRLMSLPAGMVPFFHELEQKTDTDWYCGSDPPQGRVGSGGGTAHILAEAYRDSAYSGSFTEWIAAGRRMVIHSGGASSRLPAYAPYGKSLIPMPVFRWSKGQYIDQKLLEFQAAYYEEILKWAPAEYSLLIGSGDVMFLSSDRFRNLPEADVLVFGIWVEDAVASRHGVFFSRRDQPDRLAF
ncbi:MAG: fucose pyrophosphorylase domain-containing protein, partial [Bacteroidales bacterium]